MMKKDFWLHLFHENDIALAIAVHLLEEYAKTNSDYTPEQLKEFVFGLYNECNIDINSFKA